MMNYAQPCPKPFSSWNEVVQAFKARPLPLAHPCEPGATRPPRASPARCTPSGGCPPATSAWRTSSWGTSSTRRPRGWPVGAVGATTSPPWPGSIRAHTPRGPQLEVWRGSPALAVPLPPLERGHATRSCGPSAGTPLGPGSPPRPPQRGLRPTGLRQRPTAPGAPGRGVG